MKIGYCAIFALTLCLAIPLEGNAWSKMYRVRVMQSGDLPCFALQAGAGTRRYASQLAMVEVTMPQSAAMARDGRVVWSVGFPLEGARTLQGDECIAYGDESVGSDLLVAPEKLQYGVGYSIMFNTDLLKRRRVENRRYSGNFCLGREADGTIVVHDRWRHGGLEEVGKVCHDLYRRGAEIGFPERGQ